MLNWHVIIQFFIDSFPNRGKPFIKLFIDT
ncbi:unnamed protein product, partial [Vitis vinifera]|uniref:Uncharacterized protein n=1 Tax=Vitis vinifera TaxID=29760 RepID=D7SNH2_VITVI